MKKATSKPNRSATGRGRRAMFMAIAISGILGSSDISRVMGQDAKPAELRPMKDLDAHFPFRNVPTDRAAWELRAEELRHQLRVTLGLHPMPRLPELKATIHSPRSMGDYQVEKVYFESIPGLFVTGTLYRPVGNWEGKRPGILCPHGHWPNGRFHDPAPAEVNRQLANGEERFVSAARNPIQARCVQLARMGCVVFQWDMLGYCDAQQVPMERAHGFKARGEVDATTKDGWVLFSPEAEGHHQSVMGLQTLHSMRAVDFMLTLPEVDPSKLGITGASGGGTQTFIAAALEPRLQLAFPAVMVSTGMQGGCTCENASGLRVDTGNVELAALFAPKPMGLTAANDWTRTMPEDGFPELKKIYSLYDSADRVALFPSLHYGHNYNHVSRVSLYNWVNRFFGLGMPEPVLERDYSFLGKEDLTVWDAEHPEPAKGIESERKILRWWYEESQRQIAESQTASSGKDASLVAEGWNAILAPVERRAAEWGKSVSKEGERLSVSWDGALVASISAGQGVDLGTLPKKLKVRVGGAPEGASVPGAAVHVQWHPQGLGVAVDPSTQKWTRQALVANPRRSAAYNYGYSPALRLRQAAALAALLQQLKAQGVESIELVAEGEDAWVSAAVAALKNSPVDSLLLTPTPTTASRGDDVDDPDLVPGALKYGDFWGLLSVSQAEGIQLNTAELPEAEASIRKWGVRLQTAP
ncbi:MAG: acetylxylan esterase [Pirellulaceae bacterium]